MASPQCCSNPPALNSACGEGVVEEIGGLKAYVTGSPDSGVAILVVTDIFGYEAPNLRKLADKVAAAGFYVVVPDFLNGDPYVPEVPFTTWIQSHGPDKSYEDAKPVVGAIKEKGISVIGGVGICWGAKVVVELTKSHEIKASVLLHPSFVTIDDIKETKSHIAVLGAENDEISPPELLKQFEEILSGRPEVDGFCKVFSGVAHGWTVRYEDNHEDAVNKAKEAHDDAINWFTKYLK